MLVPLSSTGVGPGPVAQLLFELLPVVVLTIPIVPVAHGLRTRPRAAIVAGAVAAIGAGLGYALWTPETLMIGVLGTLLVFVVVYLVGVHLADRWTADASYWPFETRAFGATLAAVALFGAVPSVLFLMLWVPQVQPDSGPYRGLIVVFGAALAAVVVNTAVLHRLVEEWRADDRVPSTAVYR